MVIDIINEIPNILQYFVPGFIFLKLFSFFTSKKYFDLTLLSIVSVVTSFIFISLLDLIIKTEFETGQKVLICSAGAVILSIISSIIYKMKWFYSLVSKINNKAVNENMFLNILDFKNGNSVRVITKKNISYIGTLVQLEENGMDSWIGLADYIISKMENNEDIYDSIDSPRKPIVAINFSNIESIEIFYDKNRPSESQSQI